MRPRTAAESSAAVAVCPSRGTDVRRSRAIIGKNGPSATLVSAPRKETPTRARIAPTSERRPPLLARALTDFLALHRSTSLYPPVQRTNIRGHLRDARYRGRPPPYTTVAAYSLECLDFFTELLCRRVVQSVASEDGGRAGAAPEPEGIARDLRHGAIADRFEPLAQLHPSGEVVGAQPNLPYGDRTEAPALEAALQQRRRGEEGRPRAEGAGVDHEGFGSQEGDDPVEERRHVEHRDQVEPFLVFEARDVGDQEPDRTAPICRLGLRLRHHLCRDVYADDLGVRVAIGQLEGGGARPGADVEDAPGAGLQAIERGHERLQVFGRVGSDALVPANRDRVGEPPHGTAEEPPAPGEPGDRRVERSAERPHQRAGTATGIGLRRQASPRFTPSAQTTAGFRAMVSSRTSEKPAWARAASISRPQAAEVSSLAPGPRG